jgi:hypothetical protein
VGEMREMKQMADGKKHEFAFTKDFRLSLKAVGIGILNALFQRS